ncbi:MAG: NlpC/P60 family protein [Blautia sp.]|nr:NlpC/P60 family protein [Blautia sp.]MCM1202230.1 NlpC/P60 family protein [Bacteroides fragilis]
MKRKELCCLFICIILCHPLQVFAAEGQETVQSVLDGMSAGVDLLGTDIDMADASGFGHTETKGIGNAPGLNTEGQEADGQSAGTQEPDEQDAAGSESGAGQSTDGQDTGSMEPDGQETVGQEEKSAAGTSIRDALGDPVGVASVVEAGNTREEYAQAYEDARNANWGYTNLGIANVDNNLNVRAIPGEDGRLVGKLPKDAACEVLESDGEWAHIQSGKVDGYVSCEFLLTGISAKHRAEELVTTIATVTTDSLKVRAEASTDSEVITMVPNGEQLEVAASEGDWVRVYLDDEEVFVFAEYVQVDARLNTAVTMTELLYGQGVSDVRVDLCQYAKEFLGNPYVWGGTSLTNGADCSGFVLSVYKKYGVSLPHSSRAQANCGARIKLADAQPGDLVFYGKGQTINHVAIYIGGGQVIHASSPKTGIRISNATYRTPLRVVKILQV